MTINISLLTELKSLRNCHIQLSKTCVDTNGLIVWKLNIGSKTQIANTVSKD
jgi:hypothetical protein